MEITLLVLTFLIGIVFSSFFNIEIRISKKQDYHAKVKELEAIIAGFQKDKEEDVVKFDKSDLFPADINKDYGIPKDLK